MTQTWDLLMDTPTEVIELPRPPLQSVTGVYVTDDEGTETTVDTGSYTIDTIGNRIFLNTGSTYPTYRKYAGFRVRYVTGYGDDVSDVPENIKQGILQIIGHLYENRESQGIPPLAKELLSFHKVWKL
jgi:uncharacterized phiE125 gp8 family phage protein